MTGKSKQSDKICERDLLINYLLSATSYLSKIPSNALRCHWNILLADEMDRKRLALSERKIHDFSDCDYCRAPWRNGHFTVRVMPTKTRGKKVRKIERKVKEGKELSKVQKRLAQLIQAGPTVVVKCKICQKSSKYKLPQGRPILEKPESERLTCKERKSRKFWEKVQQRWKNMKMRRSKMRQKALKQGDDTQAVSNDGQNVNKAVKNECDDNDVMVIDESSEVAVITPTKSNKRTLDDDDDSDDDVIDLLATEPKKPKRPKGKDVILCNPLPITPLGADSKHSTPKQTKNDFIPLNSNSSTTKKNKLAKILKPEKKIRTIDYDPNYRRNKKEKLSRWKKLIADEEAKPTKTSSLQDFLSAL